MNLRIRKHFKSIFMAVIVLMGFIFTRNMQIEAALESGQTEATELDAMILETAQGLKELTGSSKKYVLSDEKILKAGSSVSDWIAVALAFSGEEEAYAVYLERLENYVTTSYCEQGCLDMVEATPYQRMVLTVLALGGDPAVFGSDADGNSINLLADGTYYFSGDSLGTQGLSGYIYALLALDAMGHEVPEDAAFTREDIIAAILKAQSEDGGFSQDGYGSDVDITAMVLQALAPYQKQEEVKYAVDQALNWLSEEMTLYGTFVSGSAESCESTAQVILAMCALGLDVENDSRFQKNGMTPWEGIKVFRLSDGTYVHTLEEEEGNLIATEQALLALEAVELRRTEDRWIFDFRNYEMPKSGKSAVTENAAIAVFVVGIVAISDIALYRKRVKGGTRRRCMKRQ